MIYKMSSVSVLCHMKNICIFPLKNHIIGQKNFETQCHNKYNEKLGKVCVKTEEQKVTKESSPFNQKP